MGGNEYYIINFYLPLFATLQQIGISLEMLNKKLIHLSCFVIYNINKEATFFLCLSLSKYSVLF